MGILSTIWIIFMVIGAFSIIEKIFKRQTKAKAFDTLPQKIKDKALREIEQ